MTPASTPKRRRIPGTSVLQWQSPETQTAVSLPRRPMTACKACRLAKAKCNGQQSCDRCKNRGLRCVYSHASGASSGNSNKSPASHTPTATSPLNGKELAATPADEMLVDVPGNAFSVAGHGQPATDNPIDHSFQQALEEFNWVFPDSEFSFNVSPSPHKTVQTNTN